VAPPIVPAQQLDLSWTDNSGGQAGFVIQRATSSTGAYATIAQVATGVASYTDASVSPGTTYCYRVAAVNSAGMSEFSNTACASPTVGATAPLSSCELTAPTSTPGTTIGEVGAAAQVLSPANGSTFPAPEVTFSWSPGCQVTQYWLTIGTSPAGWDLYHQSQGTASSATVGGLPTDGRPVFVRLWSLIGGAWQFTDYAYRAFGAPACSPASPAAMESPLNGSILAGAAVTFAWSPGCQVTQYWVSIGILPGGWDLYHESQGANLTLTVSGLPTDGRVVYVRLWSFIGSGVEFLDYAFSAPVSP